MKIYTTKELAEMFQCDSQTIRRYVKDGKLKALKFGRDYKFTQEQLEQFMERIK